MKRRRFAGLAAGAAAWPLVARAQPKVPTVGVLVVGSPGSQAFWRLFQQSMRELGYEEGRTVRFEFRSDEGQSGRLPKLAAELVRLKVDVIVSWFTPAAIAAKQATRDIPIVMALAGDPIATRLVDSLARPGGNITGIGGGGGALGGKSLQYLREMVPEARRAVALVNAPDPYSVPFQNGLRAAAAALGLAFEPVAINKAGDLDAAVAALEGKRAAIMMVQPSLPSARVAQLALRHRVPAGCTQRAFAEAGGLLSYWFLQPALYRRAAEIVDKVLKGAKPADTPVEHPTLFELVINRRTAKALGLTVPPLLLTQADGLID